MFEDIDINTIFYNYPEEEALWYMDSIWVIPDRTWILSASLSELN